MVIFYTLGAVGLFALAVYGMIFAAWIACLLTGDPFTQAILFLVGVLIEVLISLRLSGNKRIWLGHRAGQKGG